MAHNICVYCSSSNAAAQELFETAEQMGKLLAERGFGLIYGGASVGLMGSLARSVQSGGGKVIGVIPEGLKERELAYEKADELIITPDMRTRKARMEERADAFVALPGGFGTLEEILEMMTLRQLGYHNKPIVFVNARGFYKDLMAFFERIYEQYLARETEHKLYYVADTPAQALDFIADTLG